MTFPEGEFSDCDMLRPVDDYSFLYVMQTSTFQQKKLTTTKKAPSQVNATAKKSKRQSILLKPYSYISTFETLSNSLKASCLDCTILLLSFTLKSQTTYSQIMPSRFLKGETFLAYRCHKRQFQNTFGNQLMALKSLQSWLTLTVQHKNNVGYYLAATFIELFAQTFSFFQISKRTGYQVLLANSLKGALWWAEGRTGGLLLLFQHERQKLFAISSAHCKNDIIIFKRMQKLNLLIQKYDCHSSESHYSNSQNKVQEFQSFLKHFSRIDIAPPRKLKYSCSHAAFLLDSIALQPNIGGLDFTLLIQVLNTILRLSPQLKMQPPTGLMAALNRQLRLNEKYRQSPRVISQIIWLVGRCFQMGNDRCTLVQALSDSQLIYTCLQVGCLDPTTQKGVSILLAYMSKRQLIPTSFSLKLVANLRKFKQPEVKKEILALLRRIGIERIKNDKEMLKVLGVFLIQYFNDPHLAQTEKIINWELVITVAWTHQHLTEPLQLNNFIRTIAKEPILSVSQQLLNKVADLHAIIVRSSTELQQTLREVTQNVFDNPIARRIYIQSHQKITSQFYLELLSGTLPSIMVEKTKNKTEQVKALKILICLKRSACQLGLCLIYEYKFKSLERDIVERVSVSGDSSQLVGLWKEVARQRAIELSSEQSS